MRTVKWRKWLVSKVWWASGIIIKISCIGISKMAPLFLQKVLFLLSSFRGNNRWCWPSSHSVLLMAPIPRPSIDAFFLIGPKQALLFFFLCIVLIQYNRGKNLLKVSKMIRSAKNAYSVYEEKKMVTLNHMPQTIWIL